MSIYTHTLFTIKEAMDSVGIPEDHTARTIFNNLSIMEQKNKVSHMCIINAYINLIDIIEPEYGFRVLSMELRNEVQKAREIMKDTFMKEIMKTINDLNIDCKRVLETIESLKNSYEKYSHDKKPTSVEEEEDVKKNIQEYSHDKKPTPVEEEEDVKKDIQEDSHDKKPTPVEEDTKEDVKKDIQEEDQPKTNQHEQRTQHVRIEAIALVNRSTLHNQIYNKWIQAMLGPSSSEAAWESSDEDTCTSSDDDEE